MTSTIVTASLVVDLIESVGVGLLVATVVRRVVAGTLEKARSMIKRRKSSSLLPAG